MKLIIDAAGGIMGRIAGFAAKQALLGKNIIIVNCNEALITGNKSTILAKYKAQRARGGYALKGPNFPRSPERIMKRVIRGMLSYKQGRGREAFKKIMCYNKVPEEYNEAEKMNMKRELKGRFLKLYDLGREL